MSYGLKLEEIENGFIITRPVKSGSAPDDKLRPSTVYRENVKLAVQEAQFGLDTIRKEVERAESAKLPAGKPPAH